MFTFVSSDKKGKLNNAEQRRVRSHVLRRRVRPSPEELDDGRGYPLPASARDQMYDFRVSIHGHKRKEGTSAGDSRSAEREGNSNAPTPIEALLVNGQPLFIPPFSLRLDKESFAILCTYHPLVLGMCYLQGMGFEQDMNSTQWRGWLAENEAYSHSAMAVSCAAQNRLSGRSWSKTGWLHAAKAVSHLNRCLSNLSLALTDCTIATIISLGAASAILGDYNAASAHVSGLWSIVHLRGGIESFRDNLHLFVSICRLDLQISLGLGKAGFVHRDSSLVRSRLIPPLNIFYSQVNHLGYERDIQGLVDQRLAYAFHELQLLARDINTALLGIYTIPESKLTADLVSTQCSLLLIETKIENTLDECVRMTLLALVSTMWTRQDFRMDCEYAATSIHKFCRAIEVSCPRLRELMLWILMMGFISSVLDHDEEWVRRCWQQDLSILTQKTSWSDVRRQLQGLIWINAYHDNLGRHYFESLSLKN